MNRITRNHVLEILFGIVLILNQISRGYSKELYELNITENGTPFKETIEIDDVSKTVVYKVPSHNKLKKTDVLVDYKNACFVKKIPEKEACYIQSFSAADEQSLRETRQNLKLMQHITSRTKATVPVEAVMMIMKIIREIPRHELSRNVADFCGNNSAYQVKEEIVPQNKGKPIIKRDAAKTRYYSMATNAKNIKQKLPNGFPTCKSPGQHFRALTKCIRDKKNPRAACGRFPLSCRYEADCELLPPGSRKVDVPDLSYRGDENAPILYVKCKEKHVYTVETCCDVTC